MTVFDFATGIIFFLIIVMIVTAPDLNENDRNYW